MGELIVPNVDLIEREWLWPTTSGPDPFSRTAAPTRNVTTGPIN